MSLGFWIFVGLVVVWMLLQFKTSRPDGDLVRTHPFRRIMFFIMTKRNESIVFFDEKIDARPLLAYLEHARPKLQANITHCVVAAGEIGLAANPRLNRFVVGKRLYQRRGRFLSFSMKRRSLSADGVHKEKLATVKLESSKSRTFADFVTEVNGQITENRSGKKTYADKEFALFNALPRPVFEVAAAFLGWADRHNLLPGFFIEGDPLYTSMFIANLGSLGMNPGFHHLYEYGNCPLFCMVGKINPELRMEDGQVVEVPTLHLRYSYDERIDDGLTGRNGIRAMARVLADPARWLGCIEEDGSDDRPLWPREDWASDGFQVWD